MSEQPVRVEATGETVGEARWAALHDLERQFPDLDRDAVQFVVVSEGQRGLLGVGYEPARVVASVEEGDVPPLPDLVPSEPREGESEDAARLREIVERIAPYVERGFDNLVFHAPGNDQRRFLDQFCADVVPLLRERFSVATTRQDA